MVSAQISSDELGLSCSSGDDLGLSLGSDSDSEEADEVGMSLSSSSESSCDDDLDVQLSIDVDSVYARPPPMKPVNRLLFSEVSPGIKMKSKALSLLDIKSALKETCACGCQCLSKTDFLTARETRRQFWMNSRNIRMQLLKMYVSRSKRHGRFRFLDINQQTFCSKAFCSLLRINKNTFSRALDVFNRQAVSVKGKKPRDMSESSKHLISWLEDYATYHGDRMPEMQTCI
ncbi:hypothetical protein DPMN_125950 [Dreissena polymorpha]|uniref:Uncharacterized protein n=1 Tax=Dreissena polymorpha TaxID=45954 RepID=A0A9D4JXI3_DREPO|nr:hypothetical protein DPMN_125950 [Dreissena polymorpha]